MSMHIFTDIALIALFYGSASVLYYVWQLIRRRQSLKLPPGPKGLPIFGHISRIPPTEQWKKYHEWSKEHESDIIYLNFLGQDVVVVDTFEAASELLDVRSAIYSGRVRLPMCRELMGWEFNSAFMDYGARWRQQRRLIQAAFSPAATKQFHPHIHRSVQHLLQDILSNQDADIVSTIGRTAGETIMCILFGLSPTSPCVDTSAGIDAVRLFVESAVPGTYLVDSFPVLRHVPAWMPGARFQRVAAYSHGLLQRMIGDPFDEMRRMTLAGEQTDGLQSFGGGLMKRVMEEQWHGLDEKVVKDTCGTLLGAASETTVSIISSCILGLLQHPQHIIRAQRELDLIIPDGTLPTLEFETKIPFITALTLEALRWRDMIPLAIPHKSSQDDIYKGYNIPKGAIVVPNLWAMLHNEADYPNPFTFNPNRFMTDDGSLDASVRSPEHVCWGFGRRICPGRHMAFSSVWITLASLLFCFNIEKARDDMGKEVEPLDEIAFGLTCIPKSYRSRLTPRSEAIARLIREAEAVQYGRHADN